MGGKVKAPPPPDYGPIAAASKEAAELSYKLGKEQLAWAKEQYGKDSEITGQVVEAFLQDMESNRVSAGKDRERYESIFQPLEEDLAQEALDYASPERREMEMGRAQSNVAQQFQQARQAAQTELEGYGINPSATRFAALDIGMRANEAAAKAAAGNQASQMVDATGRALRSEAINVGRGYPGQIAGTYNTALAAGSGAGGTALNQTASGANTMGTGLQWQGAGNAALGTWGNALNTGYNNALAGKQFEAQQKQAFWGGIGGGLGLLGGMIWGEEGGPVPATALPTGATTGGPVPAEASPSGGAITDDIPARLNAGEFIVPTDVVSWKGEEHFQKLIEQSRKARQEGGNARPTVTAAIPEAARIQSRQVPQALPM